LGRNSNQICDWRRTAHPTIAIIMQISIKYFAWHLKLNSHLPNQETPQL